MSFHNDPPGNDNPNDTDHFYDNRAWFLNSYDSYFDDLSDQQQMGLNEQQQMVLPSTSHDTVPQHQNPPIMNPPSYHEESESMTYGQSQSSSSSYDQGNYYGQQTYQQQPQQTNDHIGQYSNPMFQTQTPNVAGPSNAHTPSSDPSDNRSVRGQRKRRSGSAEGESIPKWKPTNKNPSAEQTNNQETNDYSHIQHLQSPFSQIQNPNVVGPSNAHTSSSEPNHNNPQMSQMARQSESSQGVSIQRWIQKTEKYFQYVEERVAAIENKDKKKPLEYLTLCMLACLNSPDRGLKVNEIFDFIRHHWSFFRFLSQTWISNVHAALKSDIFEKKKGAPRNTIYRLLEREEVIYNEAELRYIRETDVRGEEFYERLKNGQVGLPRQLFYHVIGTCAPQYAGPENSALFYHMLSVGFIPQYCDPLFKVFEIDTYPNEPEFQEERLTFTNGLTHIIKSLPVLRINMKKGQRVTEKMVQSFYNNISNYFEKQNNLKGKNDENWQTPKLDYF